MIAFISPYLITAYAASASLAFLHGFSPLPFGLVLHRNQMIVLSELFSAENAQSDQPESKRFGLPPPPTARRGGNGKP